MSSRAPATFSIRRATPADAALLAELAASCFGETFADENDPDDMAAYLASAFGESIQRAELTDARHVVLLAERGDGAIGYALLRDGGPAPACVTDERSIEISRLYARASAIGTGVGSALMQRSLDEARALGRTTVWLGVWERNDRAIAFYRRWGFEVVGGQFFTLGRDRQRDHVMARRVEPAGEDAAPDGAVKGARR